MYYYYSLAKVTVLMVGFKVVLFGLFILKADTICLSNAEINILEMRHSFT